MDQADAYARQLNEMFDELREQKELRGIPEMTESWIQRLTFEGRMLVDEERRLRD